MKSLNIYFQYHCMDYGVEISRI